MTENSREAELKITADASGVRAGVEQAKTALGDLSRTAEREGTKAGAGVEKVGEGAEKASTKVEREVGRMAQAIQRATAAAEAGGRGTAAYFESIAKQRGITGDALKPYLDQLRQAEAIQKQATAGLGTMGVSAAQTAAALRQVPAQFTDIATSLASGQAPLTVFLQQGGQLKDAFGGAGAAARALGGYVLGLINPFTLAAAAVGGLGFAYLKGAAEGEAFQKTLILTGNAAGVTAQQLSAISAAIASSGVTQGAAADALNQLAATGKVGADNLGRFAAAAVQLQRVGGPAVEETVKAFAELGKAPLQASLKLNESTNFLTVSLYEQIKALEGQGKATEAARVAQEAYAAAQEQRVPALAANVGLLERAWNGVAGAIKAVGNELLNVGRADTISSLEASLKSAQSRAARLNGGGLLDNFFRDQALASAAGYQQQIDALKEVDRLARKAADADAQRLKTIQARTEFDKIAEQSLDKQAKLAKEIERIENLGLAAGKSRAEIDKQIAAARERANDDKSAKALNTELQKQQKLVAELAGLSGDFFEEWARLPKVYKDVDQLTEAQAKLLAKQPAIREAAKAEADARKAAAKSLDDLIKAEQKRMDAQYKVAEQVGEQIQKLQDEEAAIGVAAAQNISLAAAIEKVRIARLEEAAAKATAAQDYSTAAALRAEIEAREKLADLIDAKAGREASKKGAEDAAREWKRASDDIERTITDALMRGFESGKGFAQTLRDTLVNTFKTLVLRPTIQALVQPLAVGLLGTSAGTAAAGTAGGALNVASGVGAAGGLLGLFGAGGLSGALMGGAGWLTGATTLGGSLGAAGSLIGTGTLAGGASGLAMGLGAIAPIAGAAAVVANALGLFRKTEYKGTSIRGTLGMGDLSDYAVTRRGGSLFSGPKWSENFAGTNAASDAIQAAYGSMRESTAAMAEQLGISGAAIRSFTQDLYIDGNGKSAEQVQKELSDALNAANDSLARFALGATSYGKAGETAAQTLERLAGSLTGVNGVLGVLGQSLISVSTAGGDAASKLLEQFGGLQQFQQAGAQYLDNFYSEAERTALATQQLTAQLSAVGVAVPATREAYRALVEAQDLNTEAGRKAYAALLQLSPAFAQLVPAITDLGNAAAEAARLAEEAAARQAEAGRRVLADLAAQQTALQVELLRAQGQTAAAAELERQTALARLTEGLNAADTAAATAAYDLVAGLRAQIQATNDASAAAEQAAQAEAQRVAAIANERAGLEQRLLQAEGNTAELRARELAGLDESNRALLERIFAIEDEKVAQAAAAAAAQEAAQAAAEAARQADQLRQAWQSVSDSIFDEVRRIRGLTGPSPLSLANAQSQFAITTAQARAGDQEAAKLLPGLSQTLLQLAEANATSLLDLQLIRAQIAASLEQTGAGLVSRFGLSLPKFDVGTNYVPQTMAAIVHEGEAIVPRRFNPAAGGGGDASALVAEVRGLREENKAQALSLVNLQIELNRILKRWDTDGMPEERATA